MEKNYITLTKEEAAKRELNHAIKMFFRRDDPICVHLVASAAHEILYHLCCHKGLKPSMKHKIEVLPKEKQKEILYHLDKAYNYLKHAKHDANDNLTFSIEHIEAILIDACVMYQELFTSLSHNTSVFHTWFFLKYAHDMNGHPNQEIYIQKRPHTFHHSEFEEFYRLLE